ncbi:MAG: M28 family peptidase [Balneolaceae bacterium]
MNKYFVLVVLFFAGCSGSDSGLTFVDKGREVPEFSADSAFLFIQQQVEFGPRVPNSEAHSAAKSYFEEKLRSYSDRNSVFTQNFNHDGYDETLQLGNIIAAFNTSASDRIMLSAHWDTRPRADMDFFRKEDPIPGADDGASGVAVLLELARIFGENNPPVGVDIVLFDGEDYGTSGDTGRYFLGSRYWSKNPPVPGYKPRFGILLDMVGAEGAQFPKEQYSVAFAPNLVDEIWNIAAEKGHDDLFLNEQGASVSDDHVIINQETRIPIIDIINHSRSKSGQVEFAPHWHTHTDDIPVISKKTIQAVGDVLTELIYNRL